MSVHGGMMDSMKVIVIVCLLAALAAFWCACSPGSGAVPPPARPDSEVCTLPIAESVSTLSVLPALEVSRSSTDPIVGTWRWPGENNTEVFFSFKPDGTFRRQDAGTGLGITTGTWKNEGGGSYRLVYDNPGFVPEHITYYRNARQLGNRSGYFSRA